jgi:SAM-dependent methyltransferase
VLSDLSDSQREDFLLQKAYDRLDRKTNYLPQILDDFYYDTQYMSGYGKSFTYLGKIEIDFLRHIQEADAQSEKRVVLFPGCGYGRSVLDALAKTKNTIMIANDLSKDGMHKLFQAQKHWFPHEGHRLSIKQDNIFNVIKNLDDDSVDTIFCTNLIHFFNPAELEEFFVQLNRVLKKGSSLFLLWEGFVHEREFKILSHEFKTFHNIITKLHATKNPYPTFFVERICPKISKPRQLVVCKAATILSPYLKY